MDTDISPTTDVCHHVAEYWEKIFSFDCALSGPFAKQFLIRLSAARTLCAVLHDVISASTVFDGSIISQYHIFVKKFSEFFVMIVHNHPSLAQDSICLPRKLAAVWINLISVSLAGSSYFPSTLPMEATHPITSPSVKIGMAQDT